MKKIAIFIPRLSVGGMERSLINLINMSELRNKYDLTVYIGYIKDREYIEKIPCDVNMHIFCKGKWNMFNKVLTAAKMLYTNICLKLNTTKYYTSICYGHNHGILAMLTRNASANNIIYVHADLKSRSTKDMNKLNRLVKFEKFKKVACVSNKALESFKAIFPKYSGKMYVINNYIDGEYILNNSSDENYINENINFSIKTFVHVSRQEEKSKKISRILESSKELVKEGYKFQILLIGEGEDTEMYKSKVREYGLQDIVIFVGKKKNPYPYIRKSSALLFTSLFEGYGMVLDEARILDIPIISTDVADARHITEEGFGILCENSKEGVYKGMKHFLDHGYIVKSKFNYIDFNNAITKKLNLIVEDD